MRTPLTVLLLIVGLLPATLAAAPLPGQAPSEGGALHELPFSSGTIDPARDLPERDPAGEDLVLVQFDTTGIPGIVDRVAATGAELVQPLAPVSYVVWADAAQTRRLRTTPGVHWAGVLPPETRLSATVTEDTSLLRVTTVGAPDLGDLGVTAIQTWERRFTTLRGTVATVPGGAVLAQRLTALPQVYSVADGSSQPELRDEMGAAVVSQGTAEPLQPNYRDFLEGIGADGTGVVVGHVDTGADVNHPALSDRIEACIDYGVSEGVACEAGNSDDVVGHGTHTLGIVLGTGASGLEDLSGFDYGLGVAPGATAVVQNYISLHSTEFGAPFRPVYVDSWNEGAIVSANSWGPAGTPQGYDEDTREIDSFPRDVDPNTPGDQAQAFVLSIMNGSGGTSTQGSPDEGKNILRVGATGLRDGPGHDDLCTCTAHGPALDGRLLPDIVAPGQNVVSTRATHGVLCGIPTTNNGVSPLHAACTGTSMASPHVTGAYAVFVDWYRQHHGDATPSPALVKAAFVNQAVDLAGAADANGRPMGHVPNNQQGWGRLHLGNVFDAWEGGVVHLDQSIVLDDSGERHTVELEPIDPGEPIKATLVWTDALGHGEGGELPAWVNDLDLTVTAPDGTAYLGNDFADGWSTTGGDKDPMNNIENVYLREATAGSYEVTVSAANVIGDGLPNDGDATDQDFALVVSNARVAG